MEGHAATDLGGVNVLAVAVVFEGLDEQRRRRSDLAPILQLAGYFLDFSRISPELYLPTTARPPLKPMRSGRAIWWRRGRSARLAVCMATGPLLKEDKPDDLGDALFAAAQRWVVSLHFNKALAGVFDFQLRTSDHATVGNSTVSRCSAAAQDRI
jgi:hypothetical protein